MYSQRSEADLGRKQKTSQWRVLLSFISQLLRYNHPLAKIPMAGTSWASWETTTKITYLKSISRPCRFCLECDLFWRLHLRLPPFLSLRCAEIYHEPTVHAGSGCENIICSEITLHVGKACLMFDDCSEVDHLFVLITKLRVCLTTIRWVRAMDTYARVAKNVEPKKQALASAEKKVSIYGISPVLRSRQFCPYKFMEHQVSFWEF